MLEAMEILGALIAGSFIGSVLGFIGAGGAMLSVPILIYLFGFTPHNASTAALAIVFAAAASGALPKLRAREVLLREALTIWSLGLITNIGGSWIAGRLSETALITGFSLVMIAAGTAMLIKPVTGSEKRMPLAILVLVSLVIGLITGLFGIGGGFLAIPILVLFFKTPQNKAAGTSLLIISINSLTALIAHQGNWASVDWKIPLTMALAAIAIANLASRKSSQLSASLLRRTFALLLYGVAAFTLLETYFF